MTMISLEKYFSFLKPMKRLKDLGVKQESLYYWGIRHEGEPQIVDAARALDLRRQNNEHDFFFSAFTVAELGNPLSNSTSVERAMMIDASAVPITAVRAKTILE